MATNNQNQPLLKTFFESRGQVLSLLGLFIFSLVSNVLLIDQFPYNRNEVTALAVAFNEWRNLSFISAPPIPVDHVPFYYVCLKIWIALFGSEIFTLKLMSSIATSLSVIFFYLWSKEMQLPVLLRFILACVIAIHPTMAIESGVSLQPYAFFMLFVSIGFYLFEKIASGRATKTIVVLFLLSHFFGVVNFYFHFLVFFSQASFLLLFHREKLKEFKLLFISGAALVLLFFVIKTPEIYKFRFHERGAQDYTNFFTKDGFVRVFIGEKGYLRRFARLRQFYFALILIGAAIALFKSYKRHLPYVGLSAACLIVVVVGRHFLNIEELAYRYFLYLIPVLWFYVFFSLKILGRYIPVVFAVCTLLIFAHGYNQTFFKYRYGKQVFRDFTPFINLLSETINEGDKHVVLQTHKLKLYFLPAYQAEHQGELPPVKIANESLKIDSGKKYVFLGFGSKKSTRIWTRKFLNNKKVKYEVLKAKHIDLKGWYPNYFSFVEVKII